MERHVSGEDSFDEPAAADSKFLRREFGEDVKIFFVHKFVDFGDAVVFEDWTVVVADCEMRAGVYVESVVVAGVLEVVAERGEKHREYIQFI